MPQYLQRTIRGFIGLFACLALTACATEGSGSRYHSPWDLAQPSQERAAEASSRNSETLKPQVDWRDKRNIKTDVEAPRQRDTRQSLQVMDDPRAQQQVTQKRIERAPATPTATKVKVGLLVPLSGRHQAVGEGLLNAAQLALFDVGGDHFELVPRDTKGTPAGAQAAARSALQDGADLIIGPLLSDSVRAIKPITARQNTPVIAFSTDWRVAGGNVYVMGFLPYAQVARITNYALSEGKQNLAMIAPKNDYTAQVERTLSYTLSRSNRSLVKRELYSPLQNDTQAIVENFVEYPRRVEEMTEEKARLEELEDEEALRRLSRRTATSDVPFDALMIPLGGQSLKTFVSYLTLFEIDTNQTKLLGTGLWDDDSLTKEPVLHYSWFAAPDPNLRRSFERNYKDAYGTPPLRLASLAYDATALAAILAQKGGGAPPSAVYSKQRLTSQRGFAGIDGIFRFRPDGLVERGLAVLEIQPSRIVVIDPAPRAFLGGGRGS